MADKDTVSFFFGGGEREGTIRCGLIRFTIDTITV